ncbi:MAG: TatD family deoxyribonuclease [Deltaproteobacteria bacterium]|nr:MAG: TatD family deoxyribonuclease [Deltaproteobacteria bacterium]TNF27869.1 MAG: TatD family deoxyribonuclease [Deltaproteobacteria bacterium]
MTWFDVHTHTAGQPSSMFNVVLNNDEVPPRDGYFSIGLHPWFDLNKKDLEKLETYLKDTRCLAIGETGLDRVRKENFDLQMEYFKAHLDLAVKYNKPIVLHCVRAYQDILDVLLKFKITLPVIFHDYNGGIETTTRLLRENNYYFSYGDKLFKENSKALKSLPLIPNERLLLETDDSKLSIGEIGEKMAQVKNSSIEGISGTCFNNSQAILNF